MANSLCILQDVVDVVAHSEPVLGFTMLSNDNKSKNQDNYKGQTRGECFTHDPKATQGGKAWPMQTGSNSCREKGTPATKPNLAHTFGTSKPLVNFAEESFDQPALDDTSAAAAVCLGEVEKDDEKDF